ncbi:MAG: esterase-like activity of phytase family protein, partial [Pseudomonadota bacterium]
MAAPYAEPAFKISPARFVKRIAFASAAIVATNCSGDTAADTPTPLLSEPWRLADKTADLYAASCPEGSVFITPEDIGLTVDAVELYDADETPPEVFAGLHYIGGFELESEDPRFGGLSGLAITRSGNLIAVSDAGHFVWIGLDEEDGFTPVSAALSDMKRQDGSPAETKSEVDAEGLAFADGLALVSFEQSHRISAFDLETCGAAARAAPITAFSSGSSFGVGKSVKTNGGIEGLAVGPSGGLAAGLETLIDGRAPMSFEARDRVVDFDKRFADMDGRALTGLDYLVDPQDDDAGVLFAVHRSFN